MGKDIDYKEKLFSLLDQLSKDIKDTSESMEAKMHPDTRNPNYAYLYDHLITCLSVHLSDDEMKKLVGEDYENKHNNYKKLLYDALDENLSPDEKQDILAIVKKMKKQIISQQIYIADKEALEKSLNEQDDKKFNDLQDIYKEKIIETLITGHYKDLYDLFKRDMYSYVEFKADLPKLKRLLFYRNNICIRNEKWDKLIITEKNRIYNIILPLIKEGFSSHKGPKILPISLATDPKEQTEIAKEIADELKDASFSHNVLNELSAFYKDIRNLNKIGQTSYKATDERHVLLSYYGRLNYSFGSKYMLTATVRRDATSRFAKEQRWGTFPSVALGWRISEEEFMKNQNVLSTLKLRASYGVTGQQDGIGNYNYLPIYTQSQDGAQAIMGNEYIYTYRPEAYVSDLKWETTTSWNYGFDFGFLEDRITGSFDYYTRQTKDLIATVPAAAGSTFDKTITTNVGNVDSQGIEFSLNATPIKTKDLSWDISFNMTWQKMKVKNLSIVEGGEVTNTPVGPSIDGYQFQTLTEGYEPYMFYVYKQLYDEKTGKPIEGAYADLNKDGVINSDDLYRYHSPAPDYIMGLSTSLNWKNWSLGMSFRANIGNYVYNGMAMNTGAMETMSYNAAQLNNLSASYLETGFQTRQHLSDYYVENASFLKMDNLTLGYNFGKIFNTCNLNVSAMIQNVFCITKYSGVDPEVPNGMDNTFYPRPRTFSLNIGLNF